MSSTVNKFSLAPWVMIGLLFFSCQKKNEKAVILLSPSELMIPVHAAEVIVIDVNCISPFELKKLVIKSRIEGDYSKTELDSSISGKDFHFRYEYLVPDTPEDTEITLEFSLLDASGENVSNFRILQVTGGPRYLEETAGHEMFSGNSGKQNAFNLVAGNPAYLHLTDSVYLHIADTSDSETLLLRWVSPAGIKFVRFNGFDYANCTNLTAASSYEGGIKDDFIDKVGIGDIYITKIIYNQFSTVFVVIKVVDIKDDPGSESDRYVFNIKK